MQFLFHFRTRQKETNKEGSEHKILLTYFFCNEIERKRRWGGLLFGVCSFLLVTKGKCEQTTPSIRLNKYKPQRNQRILENALVTERQR
jgi:hypothetical protein